MRALQNKLNKKSEKEDKSLAGYAIQNAEPIDLIIGGIIIFLLFKAAFK
jgi:hypothetical protein